MSEERYEILVCPVCREQAEYDPEWGSSHYHAEYGNVEPVTVEVDPRGLEPAIDLALFRLSEDRTDAAWREADRRIWAALSDEEKAERKAAKRAAMSPMGRMLMDQLEQTSVLMNLTLKAFTAAPSAQEGRG